jgi:hypothetical protein
LALWILNLIAVVQENRTMATVADKTQTADNDDLLELTEGSKSTAPKTTAKGNGKGTKATADKAAAAPKEKRDPNAPPQLDAEGFVLNSKGERDRRYGTPFGQQKTKANAGPPGQTRVANMQTLLANKPWEYVDEGFNPEGVRSVTGAHLKKFHRIKNTETGEIAIVGDGEMRKYAGVKPPAKARANAKAKGENDEAFEVEGEGAEGQADLTVLEEDE